MPTGAVSIVLLAAWMPCRQDPPALDEVRLLTGERHRGHIVSCGPEGGLVLRKPDEGGELQVPLDEVAFLLFASSEEARVPSGEGVRVSLIEGTLLTVSAVRLEEGKFRLRSDAFDFVVERTQVRSLRFGKLICPYPEGKEGSGDWIVVEEEKTVGEGEAAEKKKTAEAVHGRVSFLDEGGCRMQVGKEERSVPLPNLKVLLPEPEKSDPDKESGWFSRVSLRSGDRFAGALRSVDGEALELFTRAVGRVRVPRDRVTSVSFVPGLAMDAEAVVVCDRRGVHLVDARGRISWSYTDRVQNAMSARRTCRDTVLIANSNYGRVFELDPARRKTVWEMEGLQHPYDALLLENGNVLVVEYYHNRVAEIHRESRAAVWQTSRVRYPISVQELPGGNLLICSNSEVVEVQRGKDDASTREVWRAAVEGVQPWRAQRLPTGETMVTDFNSGQVALLSADGTKILWRKEGLARPCAAHRLENGNTLILEQSNQRILEVDLAGRVVNEIKGFQAPTNMSVE